MEQLEKDSKIEQERIQNERDNVMRKQHAIMQAQRRHLQAAAIVSFNKNEQVQKVQAVARAKQMEVDLHPLRSNNAGGALPIAHIS